MSAKNFVFPLPLASLNVNTFNGLAFFAINAPGFDEAPFMISLTNNSDRDALIAWDGAQSNEFLMHGETKQFMFQTNSQPNNQNALVKKGTILYAFGTAGGTGFIYLSAYYQPQAH